MATPDRHFSVTLTRSGAGRQATQRATLAGLGLRRMNQVVYLKDTPPIRGMIYKVIHLVTVATHQGPPPPSARARARARRAASAT